MRRCSLLLLVALAAALTLHPSSTPALAQEPGPACGAAFPSYARDPVAHGVHAIEDVAIAMSDGVELHADVLLPAGLPGPFPTALTITGYNTALLGGDPSLTRYGYAVVTVDDRGTGASGGQWDGWGERTQADYPEVLDWIVAQSWSDGRVGLTGASYMGITSLFTAASEHPAVKAVFATVPMGDAYRDIVYVGGQSNVAFIPLWVGLVTGLGSLPNGSDPSVIADRLLGAARFQLPTLAEGVTGGATALDGPFWRQRSPLEVVDRVRVPTFVVGGLDDLFQRGEPMLYERLADHTDARLLIGPWAHIDASMGSGLPRDGVPSLGELTLQWFDEHILGLDTQAECIPPVTQWIRGAERYESAPSWPVPGLHAERLHLRAEGRLTPEQPGGAETPDHYLQVPVTGICTRSANQWLIGVLEATPCATDNRIDELLSLTYTTEPFTEPVRINGPMQADLWVRTLLGTEAATSVALTSVAPDGTSRVLTNGLLLASHRAVDESRARLLDGQSIQPWHPFTAAAARPVRPGEATLLPIELFPTSAEIPAGHRLRLTVAAFDVPHALPQLPTGLDTLAGPVSVLHDAQHPSSVVIPVVGARPATGAAIATDGSGAAGPQGGPLPATGTDVPLPLVAIAVVAFLATRAAGTVAGCRRRAT